MDLPLAFLDGLSPLTMLVIGVIAVLLFGEQLPEVARTWGKKFVHLRRSVQGFQDELRSAAFSATSELNNALDSAGTSTGTGSREESGGGSATAPKFEPPKIEPVRSESGAYEVPKFELPKRGDDSPPSGPAASI